jgi:hypothetical protein
MRAAHVLIVSVLCAVLAAPVSAQNNPSQGAQQGGGSSGTPSDAIYLDPAPFIQEVDTNKDGNVSKEEWLAAELPNDLYSRFDRENKGYITKEVMAAMYHPPSMVTDKSGKLTLAMLRAHIARQLASGNSSQQSGGQSK